MKKKRFESTELELLLFKVEDVIITSSETSLNGDYEVYDNNGDPLQNANGTQGH